MTKKQYSGPELSSALGASLVLAARVGDVPLLRQLLAVGADPNYWPEGGSSVLEIAIRSRSPNNRVMVPLLLAAGASANLGSGARVPLVWALDEANPNLEVVKQLLAAGADPNADDGRRLARAVEAQDIEIVRALVEAGAEINKWAQLLDSALPLERAARAGRVEVTQLLLDAGAIIPESVREDAFWQQRPDNPVRRLLNAEILRRTFDDAMAHDAALGARKTNNPSPI